MTTINTLQPAPRFGKQPSKDQFTQLKDMIGSLPLQDRAEIADHLTIGGVDYNKGGITLFGQLKLGLSVLAGFSRSMHVAKQQASQTGKTAYQVQWMELPNTSSAQAWVHHNDDDMTEGRDQIQFHKNGVVTANFANHLLNIRKIAPKDH